MDNHTASLLVPGRPANSRHIEHHICGADANPCLAAAAILVGIHRGIREQRDPGAPVQGFRCARDAFGSEFLGVYLAVKRAEYRQFMGEVGEQNWRWYLNQV